MSSHTLARRAIDRLAQIVSALNPQRAIIAGGPRTGKSTLAGLIQREGVALHHGEELVGVDWSDGSAKAASWLAEPGPWICENVAMTRALRKWLAVNPSGTPADLLIVLRLPVADRSPGQIAMAKGIESVWEEVAPELDKRGLPILLARPALQAQPWIARNISLPV